MAQNTPSRHLDQFMLRLPNGMRDRLKLAAEMNKRSMNAEIVARLERTFALSVKASNQIPDLQALTRAFAEALTDAHERLDGQDGVLNMSFSFTGPDGTLVPLRPKEPKDAT